MTTLLQDYKNITKPDAILLIEKYLDLVEDLEDFVAIKKHKSWDKIILSEDETNELFNTLTK